MLMLMKKFTSFLFTVAAAMSLNAASTTNFSYNFDRGEVLAYGYNKLEKLNIAIRINEPLLVGAQITSVSVPVTTDLTLNKLGECSAFLTTKLDRSGSNNIANICTEDATVNENNILTCTFSEPYTITEEGVYVGYTMEFTARSTDLYPIAVAEGQNADGFYIFATRSCISWQSKSASLGAVSAMEVTISGDFATNSAGVNLESSYAVVAGEKNDITIRMSNFGTNPLSSFDYSYKLGSSAGQGSVTLPKPMEGIGNTGFCKVSVDAPAEVGTSTLEFSLNKVNGVAIDPIVSTADVTINPFKIVNRPVVEEFTGLWCGWCPRGFAAMETLKEEYGEDFVGLAYHNGDPMATQDEYPVNIEGFPSACINRSSIIDPGNLLNAFPKAAAATVNSNIEVELSWANEEKTILRAEVKVRFLDDQKGSNYRIGACLLADGMTDPSWGQSNYYNTSGPQGLPILDELFCGKDKTVYGLDFNDVVLAFPNKFGKSTGIPSTIKQYETVTYTEDFDLNKVRNLNTFFDNPIQNIEKLRVVGILFNKDGFPLNSASSAYATAGGEIIQPSVGAPVITALVPAKDGNPAEITFTLPTTYGGQEGILKPNDTPIGTNGAVTSYFRVGLFVDGEPYTFSMLDYLGLKKDESTIVYGDRGIENTSFANNQMTIKVFANEASTFGVQSNYVYGTTTLKSDVVSVDANVELGIANITTDRDFAPAYYDLQGRQVAAPRAGQLLIVKTAQGTKKIRY